MTLKSTCKCTFLLHAHVKLKPVTLQRHWGSVFSTLRCDITLRRWKLFSRDQALSFAFTMPQATTRIFFVPGFFLSCPWHDSVFLFVRQTIAFVLRRFHLCQHLNTASHSILAANSTSGVFRALKIHTSLGPLSVFSRWNLCEWQAKQSKCWFSRLVGMWDFSCISCRIFLQRKRPLPTVDAENSEYGLGRSQYTVEPAVKGKAVHRSLLMGPPQSTVIVWDDGSLETARKHCNIWAASKGYVFVFLLMAKSTKSSFLAFENSTKKISSFSFLFLCQKVSLFFFFFLKTFSFLAVSSTLWTM